jgi:hypothetical protein
MVGPFVGYLFLGLPNVTNSSSTALKLFNWYSVPGWCAFALVLLVAVFFAWAFQEPSEENEHLVKPEARDESRGPPSRERIREFWVFAVSWLFITFLIVFSATGFTSNLFGLAAGQYHLVESQGENWRTYVGVGAGAAAAGILFRRLIRWVPHWWEERKIVLLSNWLQLLYWLLVIPYQGKTWVPPEGLFYAATVLAGFTVVINQASIETFFSKKLTQYADVVGDNIGKWMGAYFMCASAGRFAGPLIVGGVTKIATPSGQTGYCTEWAVGSDGSEDCVGPYDQQCVITGDRYWIGGCVLLHAIPMYAAMAGEHVLAHWCANATTGCCSWRPGICLSADWPVFPARRSVQLQCAVLLRRCSLLIPSCPLPTLLFPPQYTLLPRRPTAVRKPGLHLCHPPQLELGRQPAGQRAEPCSARRQWGCQWRWPEGPA